MKIVIPVDKNILEDAKIVSMKDAKYFAFLELGKGMKIEKSEFKKSYENELFDFIIVNSKDEDLEDIFDLGSRALLAKKGMNIEDIIEALMFSELDEIH